MSEKPRKFEQKIALLNQKQAEVNKEFELIMNQIKSIVNLRDFLNFFFEYDLKTLF